MPLHLYIKPNEKLIIGDAVIVNGPRSTTMTMLSRTPILREKHILTEEQADTPLKRLQYLVQIVLLSEGADTQARESFAILAQNLATRLPILADDLAIAFRHLEENRYYRALQTIRSLRSDHSETAAIALS